MWVQASDGKAWGDWTAFTFNSVVPVNHAPVTAGIANQTLAAGGTVAMSSLVNATDADGDAITQYRFWDGSADASSGYFSDSNSTHETAGVNITVDAANLGSVLMHGGTGGGSETMWVQASDGKDWGAWQSFTLTTAPNSPPVVAAIADQSLTAGATLAMAGLVHAADPDGDAITQYRFWDGGGAAGSGYFSDSASSHEASGVNITVNAADLSSVLMHGGSVAGSETMWVQAYDGHNWGAWISYTLHTLV
jgi:hypothetical protein